MKCVRKKGDETMIKKLKKLNKKLGDEGMEMIQVAILIALAIILGLIFKTEITAFVNKTFTNLNNGF
ncbi:hypothetical protein [Gallibacter intestinalis]|uniref:Flagellin Flp1-like domain-containing protein n=1 Tax=Gallibacter intestinalis TaxID=2779356 RepID=A0ABR9QW49_9FIRM|nr:hypothetical protein [Gallibacter intestinalis]MBE5035106.1 hypothetical protein [Gallibacter intestinalis]